MSMTQNLTLTRGDDESLLLKVRYPNQKAVDLSEVARVDLQAVTGPVRVLNLSTEGATDTKAIDIISPKRGEILIDFAHGLTQEARWVKARYDLQLSYRNGRLKTILQGEIILNRDITRREDAPKMEDNRFDKLAHCRVIEVVIVRNGFEPDGGDLAPDGVEIPDFKFIMDINAIGD